MDRRPILILQMQRMGDLVLTFPLALWLSRLYPGRRIWIVAERLFFSGLMPVSPAVAYVPWDQVAGLEAEEFLLCLNLSHRPEAAALAARVKAERVVGPIQRPNGARYVHGDWQLYRASLVDNNRHNRFHWAELNGLDLAPLKLVADTGWTPPASGAGQNERIGLFLGASQEEKRPPAAFWIELAREIGRRGLTPVLLGGPDEAGLADRVAAATACVNLSGRFTLHELANCLRELGLLVTPDTGPMHLAAWVGLPCLNLSMGPVNPWETGPYQPGHYVLQAAMSCTGCWRCAHPRPYACRAAFSASRVAFLVHRLARGLSLEKVALSGLRLAITARTPDGLYELRPLSRPTDASSVARDGLGEFWRAYWGASFGLWEQARVATAWVRLGAAAPALQPVLRKGLAGMSARFALALRKPAARVLGQEFWTAVPPLTRPLSGYLHLLLQNADYTDQGFRQSLELIERLSPLVA